MRTLVVGMLAAATLLFGSPAAAQPACLDLAGDWSVDVTLTGSCCIGGTCSPLPADSSGVARFTQDGCNVCINPLPDVAVCGPVTDDHLQLSGPFVKCVNGRELENHFTLAGPASLSQFHLTGSGLARCDVQGYVATCTATASMDGMRSSPQPVCGDGIVNQPNEQCDDGNTSSGDGCDANCQLEAHRRCAGDCGNDGSVTVDEILTMVNIALGSAQASACTHGIPSGVTVDVALIIQAVNNALTACPGS